MDMYKLEEWKHVTLAGFPSNAPRLQLRSNLVDQVQAML